MKSNFALIGIFLSLLAASPALAANPRVTLQISGGASGTIVLELYADKAPVTVANFISYTQSGFYNGLIFHRVINGFMIQAGGFDQTVTQKTTGLLAPIINESSNRLPNVKYTVAMARTLLADTATSQFFINQADNSGIYGLDYGAVVFDQHSPYDPIAVQPGYCVFGRVVSGMALVDTIAALPTMIKNGMSDVPVYNIIIQSATVTLNTGVCATKLAGDVDGDCHVDMADYALMAANWLACNSVTTVCN
jgi:peptidyl-prolyl cis-trans isomerase B (cyclophilin B)